MAQKKTTNVETVQADIMTEHGFTKTQLLNCAKYSGRKDLLATLLEDDKAYTFSQVDRLVQDFYSGNFTEYKEKDGDK